MTYVPSALRREVAQRAQHRCEYCLLRDEDAFLPHETDHIIAEKHSGETSADNLCLSCFECNRRKGSDIASIDPETGEIVPLFHPRREEWSAHFRLDEDHITGKTPARRATVALLKLNRRERVLERRALLRLGRYSVPRVDSED